MRKTQSSVKTLCDLLQEDIFTDAPECTERVRRVRHLVRELQAKIPSMTVKVSYRQDRFTYPDMRERVQVFEGVCGDRHARIHGTWTDAENFFAQQWPGCIIKFRRSL